MEEKKPLIKQWYTLDQAIEKLSKENVGDYSKNDLVHYWLNGFIEFYTTIFSNIESLQLGNIEIKNEDLLVFQFSGTGNIALELSKENKKALSKPIFGNTHLRIVQHLSELIEISNAFNTYGTNIKKQNILTDPENRLMMLVDGLIRIDRPFSFVDRIKIIDR
ncbi:hypothetical protein MY948_01305 [Haemophilus influenzae]|nr:hypothetical protein [Haemophilus influenzae]